ncbi:NAD-dependent malic enzyme [Bryobacterales bacterium F-183]|nr:NAD-dependent malic enzyme [Bryobacterales bacterium F-183]
MDVLNSPVLNKGAAFPLAERKALGLSGLLPPEISSLETQVSRAYLQYQQLPDAVSKNVYLTALHDRNEVLFHRLFAEHLQEMIPIVNDLTVGLAMEQYQHESRRPRGVYLSIDDIDGIEEAFTNFGASAGDIDLVLATDAEQILGLGDWGVGGIEVSIGKLAICSSAGGIDPNRVIPVMLDVGTNREALLQDPTYIGNRHPRIRGEQYDRFIETYVEAVRRRFPLALLQWEDLAPPNGRRILDKYRAQMCTFNDDMQGTGAICLAAAISAARVRGTRLHTERIVVFGAGAAGIGVADQMASAMVAEGLPEQEARKRFWLVDQQGLLTTETTDLKDHQVPYARPARESSRWKRTASGVGLAEVVRNVQPTVLVGASNVSQAFTSAIVDDMASHTERPVFLILSRPQLHAEASPADLISWTGGNALIATGNLYSPFTYNGLTYVIAQLSNALISPGLALGAVVCRATRISDGMLAAAASAVSSLVTVRHQGASLLPHLDDLRLGSKVVAAAVIEAARAEGIAGVKIGSIERQIDSLMWQPAYSPIAAI